MRSISKELAGRFHAKAAAPIGMVCKCQNAPVGVCLFQRRKLPCLGTERIVGCSKAAEQGEAKVQRREREDVVHFFPADPMDRSG